VYPHPRYSEDYPHPHLLQEEPEHPELVYSELPVPQVSLPELQPVLVLPELLELPVLLLQEV